ncbi:MULTISPECIES: hypothetical protein [Paenibacillus]|nr:MULTISPECIES: hypothetical protein [Paenibacillus]
MSQSRWSSFSVLGRSGELVGMIDSLFDSLCVPLLVAPAGGK